MPKINLEKSIIINAPIDKVFNEVNNFDNWPSWSPWLVVEKEAAVNVEPDGKSYSWEGNRIGSGNMSIEKEVANQSIYCDLLFLKPWKSKAKTHFIFETTKEGTKVIWVMNSSLPFFMFFMKKMMISLIGMDYERGLRMLKDKVENGKVDCDLNLIGKQPFNQYNFVGSKSKCSFESLGTDMSEIIPVIKEFIKSHNVSTNNEMIAIYHKWDILNKEVTYTIGSQVNEIPATLTHNLISGLIPKLKVNIVEHTGKYQHIGNAWSMQMMMSRNKEFKQNKKVDPFEIYKNSPYDTPNEDLITQIIFPLKD